MTAEQLIARAIAARTLRGFSLKAWGAEGYTAERPFTCHMPTSERCATARAELERNGFTVVAL